MLNPMMPTRIATASTKVIHSRNATLGSVVINTAAASAILTLYNSTTASGETIAIIDCATRTPLTYNISAPRGLTAVMSGGNADVTITSEGPEV